MGVRGGLGKGYDVTSIMCRNQMKGQAGGHGHGLPGLPGAVPFPAAGRLPSRAIRGFGVYGAFGHYFEALSNSYQ